jgi:hypothetical protein
MFNNERVQAAFDAYMRSKTVKRSIPTPVQDANGDMIEKGDYIQWSDKRMNRKVDLNTPYQVLATMKYSEYHEKGDVVIYCNDGKVRAYTSDTARLVVSKRRDEINEFNHFLEAL